MRCMAIQLHKMLAEGGEGVLYLAWMDFMDTVTFVNEFHGYCDIYASMDLVYTVIILNGLIKYIYTVTFCIFAWI